MRYKIVALCAMLAGALSVAAQESLSKSIEVTKAYVPTVNGATKLAIRPRIDDTVRLQPDIDYAIKPVACYTTFASRQINPAKLNASTTTSGNPGYVSFGMGYPFRTNLDVYINNRDNSDRTIGGYVNHRGTYSKRRNDLDTLQNALAMYNAVGFFGSQTWDNLTLRGEVGYDNRLLHRFGGFVREEFLTDSLYYNNREEFLKPMLPTPKQALIDYGRVHGQVSFGDNFAELSNLNFGVALNTGYSYDLQGSEMVDLGLRARVAQMFGKHGFDLGVDYDSYYGVAKLTDRGNQSVIIRPRYMYRSGILRLAAGVDYGYRNSRGFDVCQSYVFPHIDLVVDVLKGYLIPYAKASGDFIDGSFEALSRENPYIATGVTAPTGARISTEIGVSGSAMQSLSYKAYFNYTHLDNMHYFVSLYRPAGSSFSDSFGVIVDNADVYTVGANVEYMYAGVLTAGLEAHYYGSALKVLPEGGGMPSFDVGLSLRYRHKSKFVIEAGAKVLGAREFYEIAWADSPIMQARDVVDDVYVNTVPACVDVNLRFSLHVSNNWWLYINGSNLANSRLYTYNHYRSLGTNFMLGFRTSF
ncbi:MAG: hypothetical protein J6K81_01430 [Rikenellaceae bacterium]|nr:hypothetical protein [Rikenellaceae bacterium]